MASGDTLVVFEPTHGEPPASNFATIDLRNDHPVLDFDDTTNESMYFSFIMPQHYSGGGVTVKIHFTMETDISNTVDLDVAFERITATQDIDSDGFAAVQSDDNVTVNGTSGIATIASIAFTSGAQMDSVVAGDKFRIKLTRDAVSDDASDDCEVLSVEIRET